MSRDLDENLVERFNLPRQLKGELKRLTQILTLLVDHLLELSLPLSIVRILVAHDEQEEKLWIHANS